MYQKVKRRRSEEKMKKLFFLVAVILMAIFVLSPLVSATTFTISKEKRPPQVVSHSENLSFDWDFNIPSDVSEYDYTIQVFNKTSIVWNKPSSVTPNELGERICGRKSDIWPVSDDISEGRYTIKIEHRDGFAGGDFDVSEIKGNLTIIKFDDTNRNGHKDSGEEGLAGWTFTVKYKDNSNVKSFVMTTGSDGSCTRPNLGVRNYNVTEEKRRCWTATTATNKTAEVREGETTVVTFGNYEVGTLKIIKYNDTNDNSKIDPADKKLPGWEFQVTYPDGKTNNYTTDGNGEIKIDVPFGTYTVKEQLKKDGWIAITPIEQTKNVKQCEETLEFLNRFISRRLLITKYYDHNANGERDSGEEGIGNWGFKIKYPDGSVETVTTDSNGIYERYDPPTGKYTISEQPQPCWKNSTPMVRDVEITPDRGEEVEFGNYEFGTLVIYKFNDTNHNGTWDEGELPLPNWGFRVKSADGFIDIPDIPNTDEKGSITVELPANIWFNVMDTFLVGWRNSTPHTQLVYINPCEDRPAIFGNYRYIPINIYKFNDTNGNGIRDSDEDGLAGWDFWISGPNVNKIFTTDENGMARYEDAIPGQYGIEELPREDQRKYWRSTTTLIREVTVEDRQLKPEEFGNQYINMTLCKEYGLYDVPSIEPEWYPKSDGYLNVSKHLEPHIVHCDSPNLKKGEIINVTLRVCAFAGMSPTDLVIAVDTSGSLIERGGVVLEVMRDGIIAFMDTNKAKFGENVRVGLVSWDEDIDETVDLTNDYSNVTATCERLSSNAEEDTLYHVGLNGSIGVFSRSPRENVTKVIVLITDAKGTTDGLSSYSQLLDTSGYVIHAITVGTEQSNGTVKMLENVTSQHSGVVKSVPESSDELANELTTLTVTSIERRILNNVTVIETLPKYLRALNESYSIPPTSVQINQDGINWSTETIVWDIGDWSSDKCWENTFEVLFCCRVPVDETHPVGVPKKTSEVTYTDPTNSSITKHLPIPEGGIWIQPRPWWERVPVGLWALLGAMAIAIIALAILYCFRRTPKQET